MFILQIVGKSDFKSDLSAIPKFKVRVSIVQSHEKSGDK